MKNYWIDYRYKVENRPMSQFLIQEATYNFWEECMKNFPEDASVAIQLKVQLVDLNQFRSISKVQIVHKNDYLNIKDLFVSSWLDCDDYFHSLLVKYVIITYKELILTSPDNLIPVKVKSKFLHKKSIGSRKIQEEYFQFRGKTKLPSTTILEEWGTILSDTGKELIIKPEPVTPTDYSLLYFVKKHENSHEVEVKLGSFTKFKFLDYWVSGSLNTSFTRKIDHRSFIVYRDGQRIISKIIRKTRYLQTILKSYYRNHKFITLDIETKTLSDGTMIPICICMCIPEKIEQSKYFTSPIKKVSFYLSDFNSPDHMLEEALNYLILFKYTGYRVYVHNFSYFDGVILLRVISNITNKISPVIRDSQIIELKVNYGPSDKYVILFRDSYLLLPQNLRRLAIDFDVPQKKTIFPYNFANKVDLDYEGKCPSFEEFNPGTLSINEYQEYKNKYNKSNPWNLRNEIIKYCLQDCISLYQVINKFSLEILEMFDFDISRTPTLPSLSLGIYRSNFLDSEKFMIPNIIGNLAAT